MTRTVAVDDFGPDLFEGQHSNPNPPAYPFDWADSDVEASNQVEPPSESDRETICEIMPERTSADLIVEIRREEVVVEQRAERLAEPPPENLNREAPPDLDRAPQLDRAAQLDRAPRQGGERESVTWKSRGGWSAWELALVATAAFLLGGALIEAFDRLASDRSPTAAAVRDLAGTFDQDRIKRAEQMRELRTLILSKEAASTEPTEVKLTEAEAASIRDGFAQIKGDVARFQQLLGDMSKPLSQASSLDAKVGSVDAKLAKLTDRMNQIAELLEKVPEKIAQHEVKRPNYADQGQTALFDQAVALYTQSKFVDADHVFEACRIVNPSDVRSWYYGALARGNATGDWNGQAAALANLGAEKERANPGQTEAINTALRRSLPISGATG